MKRGVPGGSRPPAPRARAGVRDWLLPALPLLLAAVVHRRALGAFFGTDDFVRLEEAVGILPSTPTLWRLVSEVLYLKLMLRLFGPEPLPFHIVSLTLHLVNTVFVFRLGRKAGLSAGAACLAASVFGAFPLSYSVLLSAVNINDIMALTFVFLALLALEVSTPARIGLAVASFVIALLSKEAVLFVPFAAVLLPLPGERIAGTARRLMPLLVAGVVFAALYLTFRTHGLGTGGPAYAAGFGIPLFFNLMTYAHWCVDLVRTVPDAHGGIDVAAWRVGIWPLAAFVLAAALPSLRRGAILFGCAWWLLALAPVLPLLAHTYGHYLYVPIAGFAIAGAATVESALAGIAWLVKRRSRGPAARAGASHPPPRASESAIAAGVFALLAVGYAVRSDALLERRATARLGASQFALDPFTRKMEIAQHAVDTFRGPIDRDHAPGHRNGGLGQERQDSE